MSADLFLPAPLLVLLINVVLGFTGRSSFAAVEERPRRVEGKSSLLASSTKWRSTRSRLEKGTSRTSRRSDSL